MNARIRLYGSIALTALGFSAFLGACGDDSSGSGGSGGGSGGDAASSSSAKSSSSGSGSGSSSGSGMAGPELKFVTQFKPAAFEFPEGLAVTPDGTTAYVGLAPSGKIVKINLADGKQSDFGNVPAPPLNGGFALGIAIDAAGDVYVAGATTNPANYKAGIHKIPKAGGASAVFVEDLAINLPNGLVFDDAGNLYMTEATAGVIYKIKPDKTFVKWSEDALLKGNVAMTNPCQSGLKFPIGANGIAIVGTNVYVANTDTASLIKIPIKGDGTADAAVEVVKSDPATCLPLKGADGIAADKDGTIYVAANGGNALLKVGTDNKVTTLAEKGQFDGPASVALATVGGKKEVLITNFAIGTFMSMMGTPKPGLLSYGPLP